MAMKIGLCFPYTQESLDRETTLAWFKRVDEGPFSTLSCGERMIGTSVDMMALMGAAAALLSSATPVPERERAALQAYDYRVRELGYARDPMNKLAEQVFGADQVENMLNIRMGRDQMLRTQLDPAA